MLGHTRTAVTRNYLDSFDQEHLHQVNDLLPKVYGPKGPFLVYDQLEFSRKKYAKTGGKRLKKPKIEVLPN